MNTKEVARYLGINEKQVYFLIKKRKIPATRMTGKWLFPKKLIDDWLASDAMKGLMEAKIKRERIEGALLAAGSNDPLLDLLQTYLRKKFREFYIFSANVGSTEGMKVLDKGYTDIAWSHLFDPQTGQYNIPFVSSYLTHVKPVIINLFYREIGFIVKPGNPLGIKSFADLTEKAIGFINRQEGSGTRVWTDNCLREQGIPTSAIKGYEREVYTHMEVGLSILAKEADVGIATCAVAKLLGLGFVPLTQECFDMILDESVFFERGIQALLEIINSEDFKNKVTGLGGYDFKSSGKIRYHVS